MEWLIKHWWILVLVFLVAISKSNCHYSIGQTIF